MALSKLKTDLLRITKPKTGTAYRRVRKILSNKYPGFNGRFYEITLHKNVIALNTRDALFDGMKAGGVNPDQWKKWFPEVYGLKSFQNAYDEVINQFGTGVIKYGRQMLGSNQAWAKDQIWRLSTGGSGGHVFFINEGRNPTNRGRRFGTEVYKAWAANAAVILKKAGVQRSETKKPKNLPTAHDPDTTAFVDWLERRGNIISAEMKLDQINVDIAQDIVDALGVRFQEDTKLKKLGYKQSRIVRLSLGKKNLRNRLDANGRQVMLKALTNVESGILVKYPYLNKKEAIKVLASEPFDQQVIQAAQHELVQTIMKANKGKKGIKVKVKGKTIKPRNSKRKGVLKNPKKAAKGKKQRLSIAQKISVAKIAKRKEKGNKEKTTGSADSLVKIRSYIQRRLPAETRRNMGRPALQNRTGRFSNSVQLLSLTEGQNSVVAKYTYLLNPYATFENAGKSKWPLAYNPKQLIAKSIRNLAMGRIEQKLTLRRV